MKVFNVNKLKTILIMVVIVLVIFLSSFAVINLDKYGSNNSTAWLKYTIVLDAGHGGRDGGCVGVSGVSEAELNLEVTKKIEKYLKSFGFDVILTRKNSNGLYSTNSNDFKKEDMAKRKQIIETANPNLVISIHHNSFNDSSQIGAQSYYQKGSEKSELFAKSIQHELIKNVPNARDFANHGDYYILKVSSVPTVIVECGYLSNPEEEKLLQTNELQEKLAYAITCGIVRYFNVCENLSS